MRWYDRLYLGESVKEHADDIRWKINHNVGQKNVYVISLSVNPQNLLDITPAWELIQHSYPYKKSMSIVGLAKGREEAVDVVVRIIEETYLQKGNVDVRDYLKSSGCFYTSGGRRCKSS